MTLSDNTVIKPNPDVVSAGLGPGIVLLNLTRKVYYSLDQVGAAIWSAVESGSPLAQLCDVIETQFEVTTEQCRSDAEAILIEMEAARLVTIERDLPNA